jgi:GntR family transcriptional regulator, trigonelline degradation regulator
MLTREAAPLRAQAVKFLRDKIVSGEYAPRTRLTEKRLEEELGVSRTVVREALRQLETENLIEITPNVGPVVRGLSYDDVVHLYQVRAALEGAAGRLAAEVGSPEDVGQLRVLLDKVGAHGQDADLPELVQLKNEFYRQLVRTCGNPVIGEMLANVQARISQMRSVTLSAPGRLSSMQAELEQVVDAIEARDADLAERLCRAHVQAAAEIALAHVAENDGKEVD